MTEPRFVVVDLRVHRAQLLALNVEYVAWVFDGIDACFQVDTVATIGMSAAEYVDEALDALYDVAPPEGRFYLVYCGNEVAGMGGLRRLTPAVAELKRIYVRPAFRGLRLGERILDRLLDDARAFGYRGACLDTAPFMTSAHRIYERAGFRDRGPYEGVEVPAEFHHRWRFMERGIEPGA